MGHRDDVAGLANDQHPRMGQRFGARHVFVDRGDVASRQRPADLIRDQPRFVREVKHDPIVETTGDGIGGIRHRRHDRDHGQKGVRRRQPAA